MKTFIVILLCCLILLSLCCSCSTSAKIDNSTVTELNLNRFLGSWYEIARLDHRFERGMTQCTATYTRNEDGTLRVLNRGMKNGKQKESVGKAKTTDTTGLLRVSFWGPFYSDYRVMMLDKDYQYALIGSDSSKYLWILSRTPFLENSVKQAILAEATRRGYDVSKLIWAWDNM